MKLSFPHKEGDEIIIYKDWENETEPIGTAQLVKMISLGRSFILEDMYPEETQIVYNWQEWIVEFPRKFVNEVGRRRPYKIRYIDTIGISNSAEDTEYDEDAPEKPTKDKFITFDNKEIY